MRKKKNINKMLGDMFPNLNEKAISATSKELNRDEVIKEMQKIHNKRSKVDLEISCNTNFSIRDHKRKN